MANTVLVKGDIIGMSGCHVARNFVRLVPDSCQNAALSVIEGDLILDEHSRILPYCIYAATGGISTLGIETLQITPHPSNVFLLFQHEVNKIQELLHVPIPQHLQSDLNRLLYISVVGALESFITELLCSFVMGEKEFFDAFIEKSQVRIPLSKLEESASDIPQTIHKVIHEFNAHDLRKMNNLYKAILNNEDVSKYLILKAEKEYYTDPVVKCGYYPGRHAATYADLVMERYDSYCLLFK